MTKKLTTGHVGPVGPVGPARLVIGVFGPLIMFAIIAAVAMLSPLFLR